LELINPSANLWNKLNSVYLFSSISSTSFIICADEFVEVSSYAFGCHLKFKHNAFWQKLDSEGNYQSILIVKELIVMIVEHCRIHWILHKPLYS
jgi:hypothetical protein